MESEPVLIREASAGSDAAFAKLLDLHQAPVRGFLASYVRHADVVDDLAQETFLDAYRSLGTFRGKSSFRIWVLGIARHRALRHLREEEQRRSRESRPAASALAGWLARDLESASSPVPGFEGRESALSDCIKRLPENSAAVLAEYYFRGTGVPEIARRTGKKEGAVWVMLTRIRQALRDCMELRLKAADAP